MHTAHLARREQINFFYFFLKFMMHAKFLAHCIWQADVSRIITVLFNEVEIY